MEWYWHVGSREPWGGRGVYPRSTGTFIRAAPEASEPRRELVVAQRGLVPWFAMTAKLSYSTNNAPNEEIQQKASSTSNWHSSSWLDQQALGGLPCGNRIDKPFRSLAVTDPSVAGIVLILDGPG